MILKRWVFGGFGFEGGLKGKRLFEGCWKYVRDLFMDLMLEGLWLKISPLFERLSIF